MSRFVYCCILTLLTTVELKAAMREPTEALESNSEVVKIAERTADGWQFDAAGPLLELRGGDLESDLAVELPHPLDRTRVIRFASSRALEENSPVQVMKAVAEHARKHDARRVPVCSPWELMLDDGNPDTFVPNRKQPPPGSGLKPASSEIFNVQALREAGFPVVVWTVNDKPRMLELMRLGVDGIISDRPDLLREAVEEFDADGDGRGGDLLDADGLIDIKKFDAQGHRGGRNLRPENTLPAMEVALDCLMTTLETDCGVTSDGVPVLCHDPVLGAEKFRRADGSAYRKQDELLIKNISLADLQKQFIADGLLGRDAQTNDLKLSPVAVAFAAQQKLAHPYIPPSLDQLFRFVEFYAAWYRDGAGRNHPQAVRRWKNAARVRFNIETKINPRLEFAEQTIGPEQFAQALADVIVAHGLEQRADIQSFDFRTLYEIHEHYPKIRTVCLFGDFPVYQDPGVPGSDNGANLQPVIDAGSPWLRDFHWPYRITAADQPLTDPADVEFMSVEATDGGSAIRLTLRLRLDREWRQCVYDYSVADRRFRSVTILE